MTDSTKLRLLDIDRAKGFGIILVVLGHLFKVDTYGLQPWLQVTIAIIYEFHMPLFMYLSGFVFFHTLSQEKLFHNPSSFLWKRFDRLIVPFLIFGFIVVSGKFLASSFANIDDPVDGLANGFLMVLTNAPSNPSISIWYLIVLFVYSALTPLLWRASGKRIGPLLILGVLLWAVPLTDMFYIKRIGIFFLFFAVGGLFSLKRDSLLPFIARYWISFAALLVILCYVFYGREIALLFCGLASIPTFHGLFLQKFWAGETLLLTIGRYSMAIYLLNTIFIGVAKIAYTRVLPYEGPWFPPFALAVLLIGLVGPMIVKMVLDRFAPLRPVGRYMD